MMATEAMVKRMLMMCWWWFGGLGIRGLEVLDLKIATG